VSIGTGRNFLKVVIPEEQQLNSPYEILEREGRRVFVEANITGNNDSYNVNVFKIIGTVRILDQFALISEIANLTNMTGIYADLWDGTLATDLTADGATLSGLPVGSYLTKDRDAAEQYSVISAATGAVHEIGLGDDIGQPFTVTQKNGADTFIRFNYTTNTVLDIVMQIFFKWQAVDGGKLELV
jgi:hypothetical protein